MADLDALISFVKEQPFCDPDNIYLLGGSRGGRDIALAAPSHNEDLAGIIILYGAVTDDESVEKAHGYALHPVGDGDAAVSAVTTR